MSNQKEESISIQRVNNSVAQLNLISHLCTFQFLNFGTLASFSEKAQKLKKKRGKLDYGDLKYFFKKKVKPYLRQFVDKQCNLESHCISNPALPFFRSGDLKILVLYYNICI